MLFQSYISASLTLLSPLSPPPSPPLYRFHLHLPPTCPLLFFTSPSFQRYKAKSKGLQKFRFLHTTPTFMEWYGADFQTGTAMLFHLISIKTNSANLFSATSAYFRGDNYNMEISNCIRISVQLLISAALCSGLYKSE